MTGTDNVVNISPRSPHLAPHATLRRNLCSASRAISIRFDLVSSRNRLILPSAAADFSALPAPPSGSGSVPTIVISSRSTTISAGPVNHSSGRRPTNQPLI